MVQCRICFEPFNSADRVPCVLVCGHSFCAGCLEKQCAARSSGETDLSCALCRRRSPLCCDPPVAAVAAHITSQHANIALLEALEVVSSNGWARIAPTHDAAAQAAVWLGSLRDCEPSLKPLYVQALLTLLRNEPALARSVVVDGGHTAVIQHAVASKDPSLRLHGLLVLNILAAFGNLKEHVGDVVGPLSKAATAGVRDDPPSATAALSCLAAMMRADAVALSEPREVLAVVVRANAFHVIAAAFECKDASLRLELRALAPSPAAGAATVDASGAADGDAVAEPESQTSQAAPHEPVFPTLERAALECLMLLCASDSAVTQCCNRKELIPNMLRRMRVYSAAVVGFRGGEASCLHALFCDSIVTICRVLKILSATPDGAQAVAFEDGTAVLATVFPTLQQQLVPPASNTAASGAGGGPDDAAAPMSEVRVAAMEAISSLLSNVSLQSCISSADVIRVASQVSSANAELRNAAITCLMHVAHVPSLCPAVRDSGVLPVLTALLGSRNLGDGAPWIRQAAWMMCLVETALLTGVKVAAPAATSAASGGRDKAAKPRAKGGKGASSKTTVRSIKLTELRFLGTELAASVFKVVPPAEDGLAALLRLLEAGSAATQPVVAEWLAAMAGSPAYRAALLALNAAAVVLGLLRRGSLGARVVALSLLSRLAASRAGGTELLEAGALPLVADCLLEGCARPQEKSRLRSASMQCLQVLLASVLHGFQHSADTAVVVGKVFRALLSSWRVAPPQPAAQPGPTSPTAADASDRAPDSAADAADVIECVAALATGSLQLDSAVGQELIAALAGDGDLVGSVLAVLRVAAAGSSVNSMAACCKVLILLLSMSSLRGMEPPPPAPREWLSRHGVSAAEALAHALTVASSSCYSEDVIAGALDVLNALCDVAADVLGACEAAANDAAESESADSSVWDHETVVSSIDDHQADGSIHSDEPHEGGEPEEGASRDGGASQSSAVASAAADDAPAASELAAPPSAALRSDAGAPALRDGGRARLKAEQVEALMHVLCCEEFVMVLLGLLHNGDSAIMQLAASLLRHLMHHSETVCDVVVSAQGVIFLVELTEYNDFDVRRAACLALGELTQPKHIKQLLEDDGLMVLTQMFDCDEAEAVDVALRLMCAVTRLPRDERVQLLSRGGGEEAEMVQCMTYALTSRAPELARREELVEALYRVCVDNFIREEIVAPESDAFESDRSIVACLLNQVRRAVSRRKLAALGDASARLLAVLLCTAAEMRLDGDGVEMDAAPAVLRAFFAANEDERCGALCLWLSACLAAVAWGQADDLWGFLQEQVDPRERSRRDGQHPRRRSQAVLDMMRQHCRAESQMAMAVGWLCTMWGLLAEAGVDLDCDVTDALIDVLLSSASCEVRGRAAAALSAVVLHTGYTAEHVLGGCTRPRLLAAVVGLLEGVSPAASVGELAAASAARLQLAEAFPEHRRASLRLYSIDHPYSDPPPSLLPAQERHESGAPGSPSSTSGQPHEGVGAGAPAAAGARQQGEDGSSQRFEERAALAVKLTVLPNLCARGDGATAEHVALTFRKLSDSATHPRAAPLTREDALREPFPGDSTLSVPYRGTPLLDRSATAVSGSRAAACQLRTCGTLEHAALIALLHALTLASEDVTRDVHDALAPRRAALEVVASLVTVQPEAAELLTALLDFESRSDAAGGVAQGHSWAWRSEVKSVAVSRVPLPLPVDKEGKYDDWFRQVELIALVDAVVKLRDPSVARALRGGVANEVVARLDVCAVALDGLSRFEPSALKPDRDVCVIVRTITHLSHLITATAGDVAQRAGEAELLRWLRRLRLDGGWLRRYRTAEALLPQALAAASHLRLEMESSAFSCSDDENDALGAISVLRGGKAAAKAAANAVILTAVELHNAEAPFRRHYPHDLSRITRGAVAARGDLAPLHAQLMLALHRVDLCPDTFLDELVRVKQCRLGDQSLPSAAPEVQPPRATTPADSYVTVTARKAGKDQLQVGASSVQTPVDAPLPGAGGPEAAEPGDLHQEGATDPQAALQLGLFQLCAEATFDAWLPKPTQADDVTLHAASATAGSPALASSLEGAVSHFKSYLVRFNATVPRPMRFPLSSWPRPLPDSDHVVALSVDDALEIACVLRLRALAACLGVVLLAARSAEQRAAAPSPPPSGLLFDDAAAPGPTRGLLLSTLAHVKGIVDRFPKFGGACGLPRPVKARGARATGGGGGEQDAADEGGAVPEGVGDSADSGTLGAPYRPSAWAVNVALGAALLVPLLQIATAAERGGDSALAALCMSVVQSLIRVQQHVFERPPADDPAAAAAAVLNISQPGESAASPAAPVDTAAIARNAARTTERSRSCALVEPCLFDQVALLRPDVVSDALAVFARGAASEACADAARARIVVPLQLTALLQRSLQSVRCAEQPRCRLALLRGPSGGAAPPGLLRAVLDAVRYALLPLARALRDGPSASLESLPAWELPSFIGVLVCQRLKAKLHRLVGALPAPESVLRMASAADVPSQQDDPLVYFFHGLVANAESATGASGEGTSDGEQPLVLSSEEALQLELYQQAMQALSVAASGRNAAWLACFNSKSACPGFPRTWPRAQRPSLGSHCATRLLRDAPPEPSILTIAPEGGPRPSTTQSAAQRADGGAASSAPSAPPGRLPPRLLEAAMAAGSAASKASTLLAGLDNACSASSPQPFAGVAVYLRAVMSLAKHHAGLVEELKDAATFRAADAAASAAATARCECGLLTCADCCAAALDAASVAETIVAHVPSATRGSDRPSQSLAEFNRDMDVLARALQVAFCRLPDSRQLELYAALERALAALGVPHLVPPPRLFVRDTPAASGAPGSVDGEVPGRAASCDEAQHATLQLLAHVAHVGAVVQSALPDVDPGDSDVMEPVARALRALCPAAASWWAPPDEGFTLEHACPQTVACALAVRCGEVLTSAMACFGASASEAAVDAAAPREAPEAAAPDAAATTDAAPAASDENAAPPQPARTAPCHRESARLVASVCDRAAAVKTAGSGAQVSRAAIADFIESVRSSLESPPELLAPLRECECASVVAAVTLLFWQVKSSGVTGADLAAVVAGASDGAAEIADVFPFVSIDAPGTHGRSTATQTPAAAPQRPTTRHGRTGAPGDESAAPASLPGSAGHVVGGASLVEGLSQLESWLLGEPGPEYPEMMAQAQPQHDTASEAVDGGAELPSAAAGEERSAASPPTGASQQLVGASARPAFRQAISREVVLASLRRTLPAAAGRADGAEHAPDAGRPGQAFSRDPSLAAQPAPRRRRTLSNPLPSTAAAATGLPRAAAATDAGGAPSTATPRPSRLMALAATIDDGGDAPAQAGPPPPPSDAALAAATSAGHEMRCANNFCRSFLSLVNWADPSAAGAAPSASLIALLAALGRNRAALDSVLHRLSEARPRPSERQRWADTLPEASPTSSASSPVALEAGAGEAPPLPQLPYTWRVTAADADAASAPPPQWALQLPPLRLRADWEGRAVCKRLRRLGVAPHELCADRAALLATARTLAELYVWLAAPAPWTGRGDSPAPQNPPQKPPDSPPRSSARPALVELRARMLSERDAAGAHPAVLGLLGGAAPGEPAFELTHGIFAGPPEELTRALKALTQTIAHPVSRRCDALAWQLRLLQRGDDAFGVLQTQATGTPAAQALLGCELMSTGLADALWRLCRPTGSRCKDARRAPLWRDAVAAVVATPGALASAADSLHDVFRAPPSGVAESLAVRDGGVVVSVRAPHAPFALAMLTHGGLLRAAALEDAARTAALEGWLLALLAAQQHADAGAAVEPLRSVIACPHLHAAVVRCTGPAALLECLRMLASAPAAAARPSEGGSARRRAAAVLCMLTRLLEGPQRTRVTLEVIAAGWVGLAAQRALEPLRPQVALVSAAVEEVLGEGYVAQAARMHARWERPPASSRSGGSVKSAIESVRS